MIYLLVRKQNHLHIIAEVSGSNPLPPTVTYNRQNSQSLFIMIVGGIGNAFLSASSLLSMN